MDFKVEHSELYPLMPQGLEGPYRESLTSYITRLSTAHCLPNKDLILYIESRSQKLKNLNSRSSFFAYDSKTINGYTYYANEFSEILSKLTSVHNIEFLTMLPFKKICDPRGKGLLNKEKKWCPFCYQDQVDNGNKIYDHLIWHINNVEICTIHGSLLFDKCHNCNSKQQFLPNFTPIAHCTNCGINLALEIGKKPFYLISEKQHRYMNLLLQIFSIPEDEVKCINYERQLINFNTIINEATNGNAEKLSKALGFGNSTISQWRRERYFPKFDQLINLLLNSGVNVKEFFIGKVSLGTVNLDPDPQKIPLQKKIEHDHNKIKEQIYKILLSSKKPLSLKKISEKLGVSTGYLRHRFANESKMITKKYKSYMEKDHIIQNSITENLIRSTILKLHEAGIYPSQRRVFSPDFGLQINQRIKPTNRNIWRDTLNEIGYRL